MIIFPNRINNVDNNNNLSWSIEDKKKKKKWIQTSNYSVVCRNNNRAFSNRIKTKTNGELKTFIFSIKYDCK